MRTSLWLAGVVALWPLAAAAQHAESKAAPKVDLRTDAHVTVQGKAPGGHQPSIAPVLGQIAPSKPAAPERPAGAKPSAAEHAAAGKPAAPIAPAAHEPAAGKHGKPGEPVPAEAPAQTARRGKPSAGPSVNDVAAAINQRLAELAELRRTIPGTVRRPVPPKKKDEDGAAAVPAPPVAVKPVETPRLRIELQWRVPVMWPDELLTTGMS